MTNRLVIHTGLRSPEPPRKREIVAVESKPEPEQPKPDPIEESPSESLKESEQEVSSPPPSERTYASLDVMRKEALEELAAELKIEVTGTGANGNVTKADLIEALRTDK